MRTKRAARAPRLTTRKRYVETVRERGHWSGPALRDAKANWSRFRANEGTLLEWLRLFKADSLIEINGHCLNPHGTLNGLLWLAARQPGHEWLWDFEDRHQTIFLRRGAILYCELLIEQLAWRPTEDARQLCFVF